MPLKLEKALGIIIVFMCGQIEFSDGDPENSAANRKSDPGFRRIPTEWVDK